MSKHYTAEENDRLTRLETAIEQINTQLTIVTQSIGDLQASGAPGGRANAPYFGAGWPAVQLAVPFIPAADSFRATPVVLPPQPLKGDCHKAMATIVLPGPGNYYLTVTVDEASDCSVLISSLVPNFGPVAPGTSETFYFPFFAQKLFAKCQGTGRCIGQVQLTRLN